MIPKPTVRDRLRGRLKALAAGTGALAVFVVTAVLLAPDAQETMTAWVPDPLRPVASLILVIATAWAVERTRNRGPDAPIADE